MTENVKTYVTEKTKELIAATSCSAEAKEAANAWLEAVGTEEEAEVTKNYIAELEEDIMPIDGLIAFAGSDMGAKYSEMLQRCTCSCRRDQSSRCEVL
mgnify:CR=1 FL=1